MSAISPVGSEKNDILCAGQLSPIGNAGAISWQREAQQRAQPRDHHRALEQRIEVAARNCDRTVTTDGQKEQ
jgi:hypothetical protein